MSPKTASSCARTNAGGSSWIAVTPTCSAPSARRARTLPYTPAAANAFRSAWMPAPPPESDVAIVSARGNHIALPSPVLTGSGSTGVISAARRGTPVRRTLPSSPWSACPPTPSPRRATPRMLELHRAAARPTCSSSASPASTRHRCGSPGYEVTVVEPDPAYRARARRARRRRARAGSAARLRRGRRAGGRRPDGHRRSDGRSSWRRMEPSWSLTSSRARSSRTSATEAARAARTRPLPDGPHPKLAAALAAASAIDAALRAPGRGVGRGARAAST